MFGFTSFSCPRYNLENLTMVMCVTGGYLWLTNFFGVCNKLLIEDNKNNKDNNNNSSLTTCCANKIKHVVPFCNTLSVKTVFSVFYGYLALNINFLLIKYNLCSKENLLTGYNFVMGAIAAESSYHALKVGYEYFNIKQWIDKYA
jgi:hypothetical protein